MWSETELFRPSFWACGSMVRMSPWLDQRRVLASAADAKARATASVAARRTMEADMEFLPGWVGRER